jgi:hypothetical protein
MSRWSHHRQRDHIGADLDTNIVINGAIGDYIDGTGLHTLLSGVDTRMTTITGAVQVYIDSGLATGQTGWVEMPYAGTLTAVRIFADAVGSIVFDIWKCNYAAFPTSVTDSICASAKPTLSSAYKSQDTTLTGWDTSFSAGDIYTFNVDSFTTITRVLLSLTFTREA